MTTFTNITEAAEYVETAIGSEFSHDYDLEAIAREVTDWQNGKLVLTAEDDAFWAIVSDHEIVA